MVFFGISRRCNLDVKNAQSELDMVAIWSKYAFICCISSNDNWYKLFSAKIRIDTSIKMKLLMEQL